MKTIALLSGNVVVNLAIWDGSSPWDPVAAGLCDSTVDVTGQVVALSSTYANGVFTPPSPATPAPDPNGFGSAVLADTAISMSARLLVASWVPGLALALQAGNVPLISSTWSDVVAQYSVSSADQTAIAALATQYGIPGL